jgi:uncharacterized protein (TIGR00266 family)
VPDTCPKCGSSKIEGDECLHCGIYISKYLAYLEKRGQAAPAAGAPALPRMQPIEYKIVGDDLQFVDVELAPGAAAVAEAGAMMYLDAGIEMDTTLGDGSEQQQGLLGAVLGAGKRLLAGESLFITVFTNPGPDKRHVAFAAPYPGKILAIRLPDVGGELIAQKDAFLAGAKGLSIGIAFQRKLGAGWFGGEGFIMERLRGDGVVFINASGVVYERVLGPAEMLRVEAGSIVAFQPTVDFDIQYVGKIKSALFGGQGFFFATLRGPGRIWLQSMTLSKLGNRIASQVQGQVAATATTRSSGTGGGLLGMLGGLGGGTSVSDQAASGSGDVTADSDTGSDGGSSDSDSSA